MRFNLVLTLILALTAAGCGETPLRPLDTCFLTNLSINVPAPLFTDEADLLFVIDNTQSMAEEQRLLAAEIPRLVESLVSGVAPDGSTFIPLSDLRVGLVTTNMGSGGFVVPTCAEPNAGNDGRLQRSSVIPSSEPPFLSLQWTGAMADDAAMLVQPGTDGCGFRQPLEAVLRALSPEGHGDSLNEGFLRSRSVLALVVLTDSDDCSAADAELFNVDSETFTEPHLSLRCWRYGDEVTGALHPTERYVDGILSLRSPDRLLFGVIGGVPEDLAHGPGETPNFARLIGDGADARMQQVTDPSMPSQLAPSCESARRGNAIPPSRLVQVAEGLAREGAQVVVQSLCQDSYAPAVDALIAGFRKLRLSSCFGGPIARDEEDRGICEVREWLALGNDVTCDDLEGRVFQEIDGETGREVCRVCQLNVDGSSVDDDAECQSGAGWYYEALAERCPAERSHAFSFTENALPAAGSGLRTGCSRGRVPIGTPCEPDTTTCGDALLEGVVTPLICDAVIRRCLVPCRNDAECETPRNHGEICHDPNNDGSGSCVLPMCVD